MIANIVIAGAIFGYAGWALFRFINKSKQGKCASCSIKKSCSQNCVETTTAVHKKA
ncbi:FeoB-associated Cys-rich membrane protein [Bacillus canaveralius]|uniref:FeoB-associated Cys-rich membrane protein n=1 Tax=Bacillus canaveralius TaxID=1403243 RepID=A0A2N5GKQ8_9BACI|nr:FeoB-associated Cys-rich membrane protein [Bacillus canaveralius]PLR82092.1 FeoB-associated Cys-rich membrane protein [Bacillus canaveralius]PLR98002.1 FeoB-associated Cys-rich membrane protein [Bacillus canaveralius]RSK54417.1 FeoB-associated Cys-rich membrane protein [Bacillus canaveralius]